MQARLPTGKGGAGMKVIWMQGGLTCAECWSVVKFTYASPQGPMCVECLTLHCPNYGKPFAPPTFDLAPVPTPYLTGQQLYEHWQELGKLEGIWCTWERLDPGAQQAWNALADRLKVKP